MAVRPIVPATARLNIAAAPISAKLSMRKSSPKPSRRLVMIPAMASYVLSRDVMPVPPVVMMTSVPGDSAAARTRSRTISGSSRTISRWLTWWPAVVRASKMASPLASLAAVRVSLMVKTEQRTDAGACARCSGTLTP